MKHIYRLTIYFHLAAAVAIVIWSSSYISTKILLQTMHPIEIALFRFLIGFLVLFAIKPKARANTLGGGLKGELILILAGFLGTFLSFVLDNYAGKFTYASNIALIVSSIPILTALIAALVEKQALKLRSVIAFAISAAGIAMVSLGNNQPFQLSLLGDLLAFGAAVTFSLYTVVTRRISAGIDGTIAARKAMGYGLIFIFVLYLFLPDKSPLANLPTSANLLHLMFLGVFSSALGFWLWTLAVKNIGPALAGRYIYLVPIITAVLSWLSLGEVFSALSLTGLLVILLSLFVSG